MSNRDLPTLEQLQYLESLGVEFITATPTPGGFQTIGLKAPQLVEYAANPDAWVAKQYGVSVVDYLSWVEERFSVRCAAMTAKKKRCKLQVTGGEAVSPQKWVEMHGQYCAKHELGN